MDHLDELRLNDIVRRHAAFPFPGIKGADRVSMRRLLGEALGDFIIDAPHAAIRTHDDIEFLLKIVREHERPH